MRTGQTRDKVVWRVFLLLNHAHVTYSKKNGLLSPRPTNIQIL